jgi:hypothetical protein
LCCFSIGSREKAKEDALPALRAARPLLDHAADSPTAPAAPPVAGATSLFFISILYFLLFFKE